MVDRNTDDGGWQMLENPMLYNFMIEQAEDYWENDDGTIHNRFFYKIKVSNVPNEWDYKPTGGGDEEGLTFRFFWISSKNEVELIRGHGDYLDLIFI